jgi:LytS/YehU family sensor histidine kinase
LRLRESEPLEFEVAGRTDIQISPLILIAFLENAFKHGVSNGSDRCWIRARLEVNESRLVYSIANSKVKSLVYPQDGEGIGLKNIKRRLDLSYPGKHRLDIDDREDSYSVILTIER